MNKYVFVDSPGFAQNPSKFLDSHKPVVIITGCDFYYSINWPNSTGQQLYDTERTHHIQ